MSMDPVTAVLDIGGKLIDRLWPDPAKRDLAKLELFKLHQAGELQVIAGQIETNKVEAASASVFVAGWRPFIGWVCGAALAYQFVARPLLEFGFAAAGHPLPKLPGLDSTLWELLFGMLGLGGLRTVEKIKGVAR